EPPVGAAALCLEGKKPIPGADVEDTLPAEVLGQMDLRQAERAFVDPWRDDAVPERDRVIPGDLGDLGLQFLGLHGQLPCPGGTGGPSAPLYDGGRSPATRAPAARSRTDSTQRGMGNPSFQPIRST